jgi:PAS domain S-box-containing protein
MRDNLSTDVAISGPAGEALRSFKKQLADLKAQEERQRWVSTGLELLNEIKKHSTSLDDYASHAISTIVKYVGANQGAFYALEEGENRLKLLAAYAFDKKKWQEEPVYVDRDSGLLGVCILEKDIIHITNVPQDYVKITSGLGEATPRCILLIPILYREQVYGVIELASFVVLEKFQIQFCERFAEGVGAEVSGMQTQEKTAKLLLNARIQADQLQSQEEELRQNMEEMAATHEDMSRHEIKLREKIAEIETEREKHRAILETCVDAVISFDHEGSIQFWNKAAADMFRCSSANACGASVFNYFDFRVAQNGSGMYQLISSSGVEIGARTETDARDKDGNIISVLLTPAQFTFDSKCLFTIFAQKISVDLF